ncbi:MAG: alpha-hydroxy-acid oxidizing protein, partial [Acinetobacter sp.]
MTAKTVLAPLTQIPPELQTIADYEQEAQKHLSDMVWQYLQGGSMEEHSVRSNLDQFAQIQLMPRMLR